MLSVIQGSTGYSTWLKVFNVLMQAEEGHVTIFSQWDLLIDLEEMLCICITPLLFMQVCLRQAKVYLFSTMLLAHICIHVSLTTFDIYLNGQVVSEQSLASQDH